MDKIRRVNIHSPIWFGLPRTRYGQWSMGLSAGFCVLFGLWLLYIANTPKGRPTFFSDPLHAVLILGAAASAIAGAIAGMLAFALKRERTFIPILSILLGSFVAWWMMAELVGS